jgi:hypothetical protein
MNPNNFSSNNMLNRKRHSTNEHYKSKILIENEIIY